jgi:hypothetical protein
MTANIARQNESPDSKRKKMTKINKKGESLKQKFIFVDIGRKKREKFNATTFLNLR